MKNLPSPTTIITEYLKSRGDDFLLRPDYFWISFIIAILQGDARIEQFIRRDTENYFRSRGYRAKSESIDNETDDYQVSPFLS